MLTTLRVKCARSISFINDLSSCILFSQNSSFFILMNGFFNILIRDIIKIVFVKWKKKILPIKK